MEVINFNDSTKFLAFVSGSNLYLLNRPQFMALDVNQYLERLEKGEGKVLLSNDRYKKYQLSDAIITEIRDYTTEEKEKFSKKSTKIIYETPEIYQEFEKDVINNLVPVIWIENIIDGKEEQGGILYEDKNIILLPDFKWDGKLENLYLLAIFKDRNLKSVRSLTSKHLSLLEDVYNSSLNFIQNKYDIKGEKIMFYFHYHPTFWHLHLHIQILDSDIGNRKIGHAIHLSTVIENLRLVPDYYQKVTLITERNE